MKRRDTVKASVTRYFEALSKRVFRQSDLRQIAQENAETWQLPKALSSTPKFIAFLLEETPLKEIKVPWESYDRSFIRYTWAEPRPYELAVSLGKNPYLSHA